MWKCLCSQIPRELVATKYWHVSKAVSWWVVLQYVVSFYTLIVSINVKGFWHMSGISRLSLSVFT